MKKKRLRLLYFIPVILWMAVIFWFSSNNGDISSMQSGKVSYMMASAVDKAFRLDMSEAERVGFSEGISYLVRKLAHFTEYLVLGVLLYVAIANNFGTPLKLRYFLPAAIVFGYAGTDELHQYFVPDRCCSFKDVLIDTAGGLTGIVIIILCRYICRKATYNRAEHTVRGYKDENM